MFCLLYLTGLLIVMFNIVGGSHGSDCSPGGTGGVGTINIHGCKNGGLTGYEVQNFVTNVIYICFVTKSVKVTNVI